VAIHSGCKIKIQIVGWHALAERGEDLDEAGWMRSSMQINNPCNKTYFPLHLCVTISQHGKDELNF